MRTIAATLARSVRPLLWPSWRDTSGVLTNFPQPFRFYGLFLAVPAKFGHACHVATTDQPESSPHASLEQPHPPQCRSCRARNLKPVRGFQARLSFNPAPAAPDKGFREAIAVVEWTPAKQHCEVPGIKKVQVMAVHPHSRPWRNWTAHRSSETKVPTLFASRKCDLSLENKAFSHFSAFSRKPVQTTVNGALRLS
jgi:hypothetical protein